VSLSAKNTKETKLFVLTCTFGGSDITYETHVVCLFPQMYRIVCLVPHKCDIQYTALYEFYFVLICRNRLTIQHKVLYEFKVHGLGFNDAIVSMCAFAERDIQYTAVYAVKIQDLVFGI